MFPPLHPLDTVPLISSRAWGLCLASGTFTASLKCQEYLFTPLRVEPAANNVWEFVNKWSQFPTHWVEQLQVCSLQLSWCSQEDQAVVSQRDNLHINSPQWALFLSACPFSMGAPGFTSPKNYFLFGFVQGLLIGESNLKQYIWMCVWYGYVCMCV